MLLYVFNLYKKTMEKLFLRDDALSGTKVSEQICDFGVSNSLLVLILYFF